MPRRKTTTKKIPRLTSVEEAIEHIKQDGSWDCRPNAGRMDEWYDAASGWIYKIQQCDDCGRY